MKKYLWIILAACSLTLTSCEDIIDILFDNPASDYTPTYYDVTAPDSVYVAEVNLPNPKEYLPDTSDGTKWHATTRCSGSGVSSSAVLPVARRRCPTWVARPR